MCKFFTLINPTDKAAIARRKLVVGNLAIMSNFTLKETIPLSCSCVFFVANIFHKYNLILCLLVLVLSYACIFISSVECMFMDNFLVPLRKLVHNVRFY